MAKFKYLRFGNFFGGQNTRLAAHLLGLDEAQATGNVDLVEGTLAGSLDTGTAISTTLAQATARWLHFAGSGNNPATGTWAAGGNWLFGAVPRYTMRNGNVAYTTREGIRPAIVEADGSLYTLGIPSPESYTVAYGSGSLNGTYAFGLTYTTFDGYESNIQAGTIKNTFDGSTTGKITVSAFWPSTDARIWKVSLWQATVTGGVTGTFYRIASTTDRAITSLVSDGSQVVSTEALTWAVGGYPDNDGSGSVQSVYTEDHSAAPNLTCLADRIHAMGSGLAVFSGGSIVGAVDNVLRWSMNGYPMYWPDYAQEILDDRVEAIIVHSGYSAVFTPGGTYSLSGSSDSQMSNRRLDASYFIREGWGRSAIKTPHGTLYVAREGLAVFGGADSRLVSGGKLPRNYFDSLTFYGASYFDDEYRIYHSAGQLIVDLRDGWEKARFSESTTVIRANTTVDFETPQMATARSPVPGYDNAVSAAALITGSATQWVGVSSTLSFTLGQQVYVSHGTNSFDVVTVQGIDSSRIYGTWANAHAAGATITSGTVYGRTQAGFISERGTTRFYLIGGARYGASGGGVESTALTFNMATSSATWQSAGTMPAARCEIRPVFIGATLFVYSGTDTYGSDLNATTLYALNTTSGYVWSTVATTGNAGPRRGYAAAYDVSGVNDTTQFWVHGGQFGGVWATFHQYVIATKAWATLSAGGSPTLTDHAMVYVPGSVFSDARPRLFVFAGMTTTAVASATNNIFCYDLTGGSWSNDDSSEGTSISAAQVAGVAKRARHVWQYHVFSQKIYLHGGMAADGSVLSDFWEFDPALWVAAGTGSRVSAWVNGAGNISGVEGRYWHGGAFMNPAGSVPGELYLVGGASQTNQYEPGFARVITEDLAYQQVTPGVYVLKNSDGGAVRQLRGGSAMQWTWRTGDQLGDNPVAYKWLSRVHADYIGDVNISTVVDNNQPLSMLTLSSATRVQEALWLPRVGSASGSVTMATTTSMATVSSISGAALGSGTYNLVVRRYGTTPPSFDFSWAGGVTSSHVSTGWPLVGATLSLVGGVPEAGTLVIGDDAGPPTSNGTYTDSLTVTASSRVPIGQRLSVRFTGATSGGASSAVAGELFSATFEMGEEGEEQ